MSFNKQAELDFERARRKAFWRKIFTWMGGDTNDLLPFDDVREKLHIKGQYYQGLKEVPIDKIVGSSGRYRDFDRAFLPIQSRTRSRWVNIDRAHYAHVDLPPVELYKMGDIYFVKDGNHRVSVARQRGQEFIDAYVVEIVVPFPITEDTRINELALQQERADFFDQTHLDQLRPDNQIETSSVGQYTKLLDHIEVHRWYLGEQHKQEVHYQEAVLSWYDSVYLPVVTELRKQDIASEYKNTTETDLYLWITKFIYYLRQTYRDEIVTEIPVDEPSIKAVKTEAARQTMQEQPVPQLRKLASMISKADWMDGIILNQGRAEFLRQTEFNRLLQEAVIETSIPGQYEKLLEHIRVHRWYLGEQRGREVSMEDAVISWYTNVYLPLVTIIREQDILADFPRRTETDLYLWIISHQWYLRENLGRDVSVEEAAEQLAGYSSVQQAKAPKKSPKQD